MCSALKKIKKTRERIDIRALVIIITTTSITASLNVSYKYR